MGEAFGDRRPCEQNMVRERLQVRLGGTCLRYGDIFEATTFDLGGFNDTLLEMAFLGDAYLRASGQEEIILPQIGWVEPVKEEMRRAAYLRRSMRGLARARLFESPLAIPVQAGIYEEMRGKRVAADSTAIEALDNATYARQVACGGIRLGAARRGASPTGPLSYDKKSGRE